MSIVFHDNSKEVLASMLKAKQNALEAIGLTAEGHAKNIITRNGRVDTGRLRNSVTFALSGKSPNTVTYSDKHGNSYSYDGKAPEENGKDEKAVYIGTNVEYAEENETGTSKMSGIHFLQKAATNYSQEYKALAKQSFEDS